MPLLYDQRYLEMSYLVHSIERGAYKSVVDLISRYREHDILEAYQTPIEMSGVNAAVRTGRTAFEDWVRGNHPSLHDDLWGQYWLAGTAAGLSYCYKAGQADEMAGGADLCSCQPKQYFGLFEISLPAEASQL